MRQRYGPVHCVKISENIRNLFTQTPYEFISRSKRKISQCNGDKTDGESLTKLLKAADWTSDFPEDDLPMIKVTEEQFEKMLTVKKNSRSGKLRKICEECGFRAKSLLALFSHMGDHLGPLTHICKACSMKLSTKTALMAHKRTCHSKGSVKCIECPKILPSLEKMHEHLNAHRKFKPYQCKLCDNRFQSLHIYRKHLKVKHKMQSLKELNLCCKVCNCHFYTDDHLFIHKLNHNHHNNKEHLKCKVCNFTSTVTSVFVNHLLKHTPEHREMNNLSVCEHCKRVFFSHYSLDDHKKKNHQDKQNNVTAAAVNETHTNNVDAPRVPENYNKVTCGTCLKVFANLSSLQKHLETEHSGKSNNTTATAGGRTAQTAAIRNSTQSVGNAASTPPATSSAGVVAWVCNMCCRKFNSEHYLNVHMKLHTGNRPVFQCEECGFVYAKRTQVLEHIRNDHAEQVEKHQQMQQQQQQQQQQPVSVAQHHPTLIAADNSTPPIYGAQQTPTAATAYPGGQIVAGLHNQAHMVQTAAQAAAAWNQLKIPNVDQPQDVTYNFPNFNTTQFF